MWREYPRTRKPKQRSSRRRAVSKDSVETGGRLRFPEGRFIVSAEERLKKAELVAALRKCDSPFPERIRLLREFRFRFGRCVLLAFGAFLAVWTGDVLVMYGVILGIAALVLFIARVRSFGFSDDRAGSSGPTDSLFCEHFVLFGGAGGRCDVCSENLRKLRQQAIWERSEARVALDGALHAYRLKEQDEAKKELVRRSSVTVLRAMDPIRFEYLVADLFCAMGWKTLVTPASGDDGIDVIAERNGIRMAIQCKRYTDTKVSQPEVQRVYGAAAYAKAEHSLIVTTHYFTDGAITAGKRLGVQLVDCDQLVELINSAGLAAQVYR